MIIHGGCMELGGVFCMNPALIWGTDKFDIGKYFEFKILRFFIVYTLRWGYFLLQQVWFMDCLQEILWGHHWGRHLMEKCYLHGTWGRSALSFPFF